MTRRIPPPPSLFPLSPISDLECDTRKYFRPPFPRPICEGEDIQPAFFFLQVKPEPTTRRSFSFPLFFFFFFFFLVLVGRDRVVFSFFRFCQPNERPAPSFFLLLWVLQSEIMYGCSSLFQPLCSHEWLLLLETVPPSPSPESGLIFFFPFLWVQGRADLRPSYSSIFSFLC